MPGMRLLNPHSMYIHSCINETWVYSCMHASHPTVFGAWDTSLRLLVTPAQMMRGESYVPCRSVCNQNQNWIKQSKPFWEADQGIKVTSKLLKSTDQELHLQFDFWSLEFKRSRAQKIWLRSQTLQQVIFKVTTLWWCGLVLDKTHPEQGVTLHNI